MNKDDLISAIAERSGESKAAAARVVEALQDVIIETVVKGEDVKLTGFAAFTSVERAARTMKNPRTQEEIQVEAKTVPKIRPLKRFTEAFSANAGE